MIATRNYYRVWMKDGYAIGLNAENEDDARAMAIVKARESTAGCAMNAMDRKQATTVDFVEKIGGAQ